MFSAAAGAIAALLLSRAALAQAPPPAPAAPPAAEDDDEGPVTVRPLPPDDRSGRFTAFAGAGVVVPAGDLGAGLTFGDVADAGFAAEGGLAIGLTRYSNLVARGQYGTFSAPSRCSTCAAQMFSLGLGLVYHATQALGFDPWVRFGAGYRSLSVRLDDTIAGLERLAPAAGSFHGVDVASFALGGDFFPIPQLGVGIFVGGDVGIAASAPTAEARGAVYGLFHAGIRIALEPQRKAVTATGRTPGGGFALQERAVFGSPLYNRAGR